MKLRLGTKFIMLVVIILTSTLALANYYTVKVERQLIEDELIERGNALGHLASMISPEAILAHDYIALNHLMKETTSQRNVEFSVILDSQRQPLTSYYDEVLKHRLGLDTSDPATSYRQIMDHSLQDSSMLPQVFPIYYEGNELGHLVIGISRDEVEDQLALLTAQRTLSYAAIILFLVMAIYIIFRHSVLVPINRLVVGSKQVAHGNLDTYIDVVSKDEMGELTEMFNVMTTEIRSEREELSRQASFDSLTGLPNRLLARDRLEVEIRRARRDSYRVAVMFIDLDNFKIINDTMGHAAGDALLVEVGRRMACQLRDGDTIARLGGDEFVVILPGIEQISEVEEVSERMMEAVSRPIHLREREVRVGYSMGAALYPDDGVDVQTLMANADNAMYQAKASSSEILRFFSSEMNEEIQNKMHLEQDLHCAIDNDELRLNFQPIINIETGNYRTAEVLVRWHHPERGVIPPGDFIPLAEVTGQILQLGEWILREAVRSLADWESRGLQPTCFSINISRVQLQGNIVDLTKELLSEHAINPGQLIFEITESVLMEKVDSVQEQLVELDRIGIRLALDDFGTGYSSLSYLNRFPFHLLKLDKSFVDGVPSNPSDSSLMQGIIALADGLELNVIAEGVERQEQLNYLRTLGCDAAQGYLIGRPMDKETFEAYLSDQLGYDREHKKWRDLG